MSRAGRFAGVTMAVMIALAAWGCGQRLQRVLLPEARPALRLEYMRLAPPAPDTCAWLARWSAPGHGRPIAYYLYAVDPASVDAVDPTWVRTTATRHLLTVPRQAPGAARPEPRVFVVRAVDEQGVMSEPKWFAFAADNVPPGVRITSPEPSTLHPAVVPPSIRIRWTPVPDGFATVPAEYRYRLFTASNPDFPEIPDFLAFVRAHPDSFRRLYAPGFPGWTSVPGETTSVVLSDLVPGTRYLFAIMVFDRAGDYDPVFSFEKNLLEMQVVVGGTVGPILTMFNEAFHYTYPTGGWRNDASRHVNVDLAAVHPVTVNWVGAPQPGAAIAWYRWVLGPADLADETPRSNEATDWHRWSAPSPHTTSATVGPFDPPDGRLLSQLLFIEAEDTNGHRSLGIVHFIVRRPAFTHELLFVDDTRSRPDLADPGGGFQPPAGPWPTAAELDTFLFARGGFPWRGYPAGTLSPPGIFNGYRFDTLGTRGLGEGVSLELLSRYRHVVWYTDDVGAGYHAAPADRSTPITALREMSRPGHASALAAYVQQGGRLWLCGGGAAMASLIDWNRSGTSPLEYTANEGELAPGRFMYDFARWREGIQILPSIQVRRFGTTAFGSGSNRPGRHWPPAPPPPTPPAPPDYTLLPARLQPKSPATDPVPPLRNPDGSFYRGNYTAEYIHRPTFIREDYDDDPEAVAEYSTLDTLYITEAGLTAPGNRPVMTYYHGRDSQPVVFSGFNFWYWRRSQCIELVDWVLQQVWGLPRDPAAPREPGAAAPVALR